MNFSFRGLAQDSHESRRWLDLSSFESLLGLVEAASPPLTLSNDTPGAKRCKVIEGGI